MISEHKKEKSDAIPLLHKILAWLFIFSLLIFLGYFVISGFIESYNLGIMNNPYFWIGCILWSLTGFFYYELTQFFRIKSRVYSVSFMIVCFVLYHLAKSDRFPSLYALGMTSLLSPIVAVFRGLLFEKPVKDVNE